LLKKDKIDTKERRRKKTLLEETSWKLGIFKIEPTKSKPQKVAFGLNVFR